MSVMVVCRRRVIVTVGNRFVGGRERYFEGLCVVRQMALAFGDPDKESVPQPVSLVRGTWIHPPGAYLGVVNV